VSRSWFYKWRGGALPPRAQRRQRLKVEVARLFKAHEGKYGSPRITADLRDAGWRVSQNTVAALMREQGLAARCKRRRRGTTRPGKGRWRAPDLVRRDFPASQLNRKWYGDGTEIPTGEGKLYLASVLDMASRRVLGFALGEHHDAALACGALAMAITVRGGRVAGVILHTDPRPAMLEPLWGLPHVVARDWAEEPGFPLAPTGPMNWRPLPSTWPGDAMEKRIERSSCRPGWPLWRSC
jgi:putative transposase